MQVRARVSYFKNLLLALTLFSHIFGSVAFATGPQCSDVMSGEAPVLSPEAVELAVRTSLGAEYEKYRAWSQLAVIKLMKKTISKKVEAKCAVAGCTEEQVAQLVRTSIVESFETVKEFKSRMGLIRGYATLVGASVGIAFGAHYLTAHLSGSEQFLSVFITTAASTGLLTIAAPLWNTLQRMSRGAFRLKSGKSFFREDKEEEHLQKLYEEVQKKLTPNEQQVASRLAGLLGAVESTFAGVMESIQSSDPSKGGFERASARIALTAIKVRKYYPDLGPDDADLNMTVRMLFTQFLRDVDNREKIYTLTLKQIADFDPEFADPQTAEVYRRTIRGWVGLD